MKIQQTAKMLYFVVLFKVIVCCTRDVYGSANSEVKDTEMGLYHLNSKIEQQQSNITQRNWKIYTSSFFRRLADMKHTRFLLPRKHGSFSRSKTTNYAGFVDGLNGDRCCETIRVFKYHDMTTKNWKGEVITLICIGQSRQGAWYGYCSGKKGNRCSHCVQEYATLQVVVYKNGSYQFDYIWIPTSCVCLG